MHSAPLSASLSAGVCRGLLLFHRHLSLAHSTIPALFICLWSLNGKGWHGNECATVETRLKCGRHIPLFAALSWLRSPKVAFSVYFHWYVIVCDLIGLYQVFMPPSRDTWSLWPMPAFAFSPSSWNPHGRWGSLKQNGRCFSIRWSDISSPKYYYCQTEWALIFSVWFAAIICSLTVYAAAGNERMLMLWGEWTWIIKWQMNADCLCSCPSSTSEGDKKREISCRSWLWLEGALLNE